MNARAGRRIRDFIMNEIARTFILIGSILVVLGVGLSLFGKISGLGKLPGDLLIKKENFTFYFPLTTSLLISALLSLILYLWNRR